MWLTKTKTSASSTLPKVSPSDCVGASMLSIKNASALSKNNNSKANASAVKFQFRDESDKDDDNFF